MPEDNIKRWSDTYGDRAEEWLDRLPGLVADYAQDWNLDIHEPLTGGSVCAVIAAEQQSDPVVLKIHPPWLTSADHRSTSAQTEAAAFKLWDGNWAPKLLAHDQTGLLLERITPAMQTPELTAKDIAMLVDHTSISGDADLFMPLGIPILQEEIWKRYWRADAQRPREISTILLLRAAVAASNLSLMEGSVHSPGRWELIHGDMKDKNVLRRSDGRLAVVDPSPSFGGALYDIALWAIDKPELILQRCGDAAEELGVNSQIVGSIAMALAIPEICLASPGRAQRTLQAVRDISGARSIEELEDYYTYEQLIHDNFMDRPYYVNTIPDLGDHKS